MPKLQKIYELIRWLRCQATFLWLRLTKNIIKERGWGFYIIDPDKNTILDAPKEIILRDAAGGCKKSQKWVANAYATGEYGLPQDGKKLEELAFKKKYPLALGAVCTGYAHGLWGLKQSPEKLFKLTNQKHCMARMYVIKGLEEGRFGFRINLKEAERLKTIWSPIVVDPCVIYDPKSKETKLHFNKDVYLASRG